MMKLKLRLILKPVTRWLFLVCSALLGTIVYGQDPPQYGTSFSGVPDSRDAAIYQVNAREFSPSRNLAGVTAKLDYIKSIGVNVIYLMPIYKIGVEKASGSPYCIADFNSVASDLGTLQDLRDLVDGAHRKGMSVMLDWVVNQTSWDHPWVTSNKNWYQQDASGNILSPSPSPGFFFTDCAALNFNNTDMRTAMVNAMRYWVFAANIDGFRCDWADNPPQDFWANTISSLRSITNHNLLLLAEGSNQGTQTGCNTCGQNQQGAHYSEGFDFIFGENFYWNFMKTVYNSGEPATDLDKVTNAEYAGANAKQLVARYMTNHDEYGTDGSPYTLFGGKHQVLSGFVIASYYHGVPFIYNGLEVGNTSSLTYPWNSGSINWTEDLNILAEMQKLMSFRNNSTAIRRGDLTSYINNDVVAFTKIAGTEKAIVIANVRNASKEFTIPTNMAGSYQDYSGNTVTLTAGANQSLLPYQYLILTNVSIQSVSVTGVTLSPINARLNIGATQTLVSTIIPTNATNTNVSWSSSNSSVASVSATGIVTALSTGTTTITVTTQDGNQTATAIITVNPASSFTVYFYDPSTWGTNLKIYWWSAQPNGVLADGTWPGVAMTNVGNGWYSYTFNNISSTNLIFNDGTNQTTNLSRGKTGWFYNGTWYDNNPIVTVAVTGVTVSPTSISLVKGATQQLSVSILPATASNQNVTWSSTNTAVATVNASGLVTAVAAGTTTIAVATQDGNKTALVSCTVTPITTTTTYFQIKNRWQTNTYLYDAGNGQAKYGTNSQGTNDYTYQWALVDLGNGFDLLQNRASGNYMNVENQTGIVECTTADKSWWSAMWLINSTGDGWNYIQNRWQTSEMVNIESLLGYAQYSGAQTGWYSAMWQFVPTTSTTSANQPPIISVTTPPNQATYNAPASVTVSATASDSDGSISKVEFYNGTQLLGTSTGSPYFYTWKNVVAGIYNLNAKAYDNQNAVTTSGTITITVNTVVITDQCAGLATYVENNGYIAGSKVKNAGNEYECKEWPYSGWCNGAAWAYAPGIGSYWTDAWYDRGSCSARESNDTQSSSDQSSFIFPNPATNEIAIQLDVNCQVTIYNAQGVEVKSTVTVAPQESLNISPLPSGLYTVKIDTGAQIITRMLVKN